MQIYQILNKVTGKSYVGKSKDYLQRWKKHQDNARKKINRRLYDSINFHGVENFEVYLLEDINDLLHDQDFVNSREIYWIKKLRTLMPEGYNMTLGGDGGNTLVAWSREEKEELWKRQAEARRGYSHSDETKEKISKALKDSWENKTEEERTQNSERMKLLAIEHSFSIPQEFWAKEGCEGFFAGKSHTEATKQRLSLFRTGKTYEDLFDHETSERLKKMHRESFLGDRNPRFVDFNNDLKELAFKTLISDKIKISDLSENLGISPYKIRQWFRELGVDNFQKLKYDLSDEEWKNFWRKKYEGI